jgi:hypothetical protein
MFLEKYHNNCVRIQYFVGDNKEEVIGHISSENPNFLFLRERNQMIKISSIASIFEEPEQVVSAQESKTAQRNDKLNLPREFEATNEVAVDPLHDEFVMANSSSGAGSVSAPAAGQQIPAALQSASTAQAVSNTGFVNQDMSSANVYSQPAEQTLQANAVQFPQHSESAAGQSIQSSAAVQQSVSAVQPSGIYPQNSQNSQIQETVADPFNRTGELSVKTQEQIASPVQSGGGRRPNSQMSTKKLQTLDLSALYSTDTPKPAASDVNQAQPQSVSMQQYSETVAAEQDGSKFFGTAGDSGSNAVSAIDTAEVQSQPASVKQTEQRSLQSSAEKSPVAIQEQKEVCNGQNTVQFVNDETVAGAKNQDAESKTSKTSSRRPRKQTKKDDSAVYKNDEPSMFTLIKSPENIRKAEEKKRKEEEKKRLAAEKAAAEAAEREKANTPHQPAVVSLSTATPAMFTIKHRAKPAPEVQVEEAAPRQPKSVSLTSAPPFDFVARQSRLAELVKAASRALVNPMSAEVSTPQDAAVDPLMFDSMIAQPDTRGSQQEVSQIDSSVQSTASTENHYAARKLTSANTRISVAMPSPEGFEESKVTEPKVNRSSTLEKLIGNSKAIINEAVSEAKKVIRFAPPSSFDFTRSGKKSSS